MALADFNRSAFDRFFAHESAGGVVLGIAALLALALGNSPWKLDAMCGSLVAGAPAGLILLRCAGDR